jgi:predicted regulator of Ras-like GTPase activity (Roadblock/LC7/MglB family)
LAGSESFIFKANNMKRKKVMSSAKEVVDQLMSGIDGAVVSAIVDSSGMLLASAGSGVDMELAAAGNSEVVRAKMKTMKSLGLKDEIEDILITLGKQYHIIRPTAKYEGMFIYVVLDKLKSNLALARRQVLTLEGALKV